MANVEDPDDKMLFAGVLRTWRDDQKLSTLDVSRLLYTDDDDRRALSGSRIDEKTRAKFQRRISYLETGRTALTPAQREALLEDRAFVAILKTHMARDSRPSLNVVREDEFPARQQDFLEKWNYDYRFFFVNAAGIPMFQNPDALAPTWRENIQKGVSYHLIWDFSAFGIEGESGVTWAKQQSIFEEFLASEDMIATKDNGYGFIEVFAFRNSLWDKNDPAVNEICEDLRRWKAELAQLHAKYGAKGVDLLVHEPFDLSGEESAEKRVPRAVHHLVRRYNYAAGATLAYIPKGLGPPPVVQLECADTVHPFAADRSRSSEWQHVFLGAPHDKRFAAQVRAFDQWANERYPERTKRPGLAKVEAFSA